MKKIWGISLLITLLAFSIGIYRLIPENKKHFSPKNIEDSKGVIKHSSHLFDEAFLDQAYEKSKAYQRKVGNQVLGGIVPHHLLAAPLIAGFFEGLSGQKITTVILIGPNHYDKGSYAIITSTASWSTLYGDIEPDTEKVNKLLNQKVAYVNEEPFEDEHSIYGITSFIKKTFPDARIIPLVLKNTVTRDDCNKLVESLKKIIDNSTLVVASVDFSHYLPSNDADKYDKESISLIESFDFDKIFKLHSVRNLDSPASIYTLVKLMKDMEVVTPILVENTNSAKLTNQPSLESTTSYVTMYFTDMEEKLSINSIFDYKDPDLAADKNSESTLIATGDVIPARSVNAKMVRLNNFVFPFEKTVNLLKTGDIVLVNLESPLIPNCNPTDEGMIFCGDIRVVEGLIYAGVNVANIANNHTGNQGYSGIKSTVNLLNKNKIKVTGNGVSSVLNVKGKSFGFLGYNDIGRKEPGIAWADVKSIREDIQKLKQDVDFVIVSFHWGVEYISTSTERQKELAHAAIDAGSDLIIGNHPHWVQGVEIYKGKLISYAHGNFVFDQMWSQETREGVIGKYIFNEHGLSNVEFYPIIIEDYAQPRFASELEASRILDRMRQSSISVTHPDGG